MTPSTIKLKRQSLERFDSWCLTEKIRSPQEIDLDVMEDYRQFLHHSKKKSDGKPLSINTQYKFLTDLKLFLRRLYCRRVITNGEFESFEMPRCKKGIPRVVLSPKEIESIFVLPTLRKDLIGIRDRAILELLYASAIRRSEVARLRLSHLELDKFLLQIVEGKGLKDRRIPINNRAGEWINRYLFEIRPKLATLLSEDYLFITASGNPMKPDQIGQMVGKYVRRAGIDKPGACHLFRHAVATSMLNAGADIRYVQELLGHSDLSTTQIYTHVAIEQLQKVYERTHPAI
ncbi:tyrosine-type recombinase/integrase [Aliikangiella maris]|uniref:Tyrosine-type recombinase/integrase n=2 Tax=Aliikangiella maris TaxID=3162458 RepID=A0ABV3MTH9_9GAMM